VDHAVARRCVRGWADPGDLEGGNDALARSGKAAA
jgi:hypothetical protein